MRVQAFVRSMCLLALCTSSALAQDAAVRVQELPPAQRVPVQADQVVHVTGSRLGQREDVQTQHVISMTAVQLRRTGATTLNEALLQLPSVSLQGINKNLNNGGRGVSAVDLRSLGPQRTLVLIDGRRVVPISVGRAEAVDLSFIPLELVERIDILLDGASAVYGSDAIGGVINVILKRDFDGMRTSGFAGISSHGDAEEAGGSLTLGRNHSRGNVTLSLQGLYRAPLLQRRRDWAHGPVSERTYVDPTNPAAGIVTNYGSGAAPVTYEADGSATAFRPDPTIGAGFTRLQGADPQRFAYGDRQYLVLAEHRIGGTLLAMHELTDHVHAFLEASYVFRHSAARSSPSSFAYGTTTYPSGFLVPADNPFIPADYASTLDPSVQQLQLTRTNTELGDVSSAYDVHTSRAVVGLGGEVSALELEWELYANVGLVRAQTTTHNLADLSRATLSANRAACDATAGCFVGNYFGTGTLQPEAVDYIRYTGLEYAGNSHVSSGASISARPFSLWGERVGIAAGLLARREQAFYRPSKTAARGDATSDIVAPTHGAYRALDVFAELGIPLLAHLPGVELVRLDLAARYAMSQRFGSLLTYRVGLSYAPIAGLTVRASVATAFRAPGVTELFGGQVSTYQYLQDPCDDPQTAEAQRNCANVGAARSGGPALVNASGNRNLSAERARTLNLGMAYQSQLRRAGTLRATWNYYRTVIDDEIVFPTLETALPTCYASPSLSAASCEVIGRDANGNLTLDGRPHNASTGSTSGVELSAAHSLPFAAVGWNVPVSFDLSLQLHRLLYWDTVEYGVKTRSAGTIAASYGSMAKWRCAWAGAFSGRNWSVASAVRYLGAADVSGAAGLPDRGVPAVTYWDLSASYRVQEVDLIAGVNNLLDRKPPFLLDYDTNSNPFSYDYVGRYFFLRASHNL